MRMDTRECHTQPFCWFDTTELEKVHDQIVADHAELKDHLSLIHNGLNALHIALRLQSYQDGETLVVLRLCARTFNTTGAALKSARSGFFQPAFAMVRDLLEIEFLADLFTRDREHLRRWINLEAKARKKEFQQVKVRTILDELDGFVKQRRKQEYELLSKYAAHVDPDGFQIISPGNMTQIGPFPSVDLLTAFLQEMAKHLTMACIHLMKLLHPLRPEVNSTRRAFDAELVKWRRKYSPAAAQRPTTTK
jgi:hypothetical protein